MKPPLLRLPVLCTFTLTVVLGTWASVQAQTLLDSELVPGTVVAWGDNNFGQSNVPAGLSNVVAVAAGYAHSLALKQDGTVLAWGHSAYGQTNVPSLLTSAIAI